MIQSVMPYSKPVCNFEKVTRIFSIQHILCHWTQELQNVKQISYRISLSLCRRSMATKLLAGSVNPVDDIHFVRRRNWGLDERVQFRLKQQQYFPTLGECKSPVIRVEEIIHFRPELIPTEILIATLNVPAAVVPFMFSTIYGLRNVVVAEFNHVENLIFTPVLDVVWTWPKIGILESKHQSSVQVNSKASWNESIVRAMMPEHPLKIPIANQALEIHLEHRIEIGPIDPALGGRTRQTLGVVMSVHVIGVDPLGK